MTAPHDHAAPATGTGEATAAQYVYGVTRADARLPEGLTGLDDHPVTLVAHEHCAALTSDLPAGRPLGRRADLMAHERVLDALVDAGTVVLPFRFGAAMAGTEAVEKELLAANGERLGQVLDQLDGRLEMRVRGTYVQDALLREVMADDPQVAELNQRLRSIPADAADAAYYDRVRLGEMIARALEQRREHDGQVLLEALAPAAEAMVRKPPAREEDVLDVAFLIGRDRLADFQRAVEEIGAAHADRVTLRLIGPLPPYDFVPEA